MNLFYKVVDKITQMGVFLASIVLLAMMLIIVANVLYRIAGGIIPGSYDLVELLIIVVAGVSMDYTALKKHHISANIFVSRFSDRNKAIVDSVTSLLGSAFWILVAMVAFKITLEKAALGEKTELLEISFIPFRWIWVFTLILLSLILALNGIKSLMETRKK